MEQQEALAQLREDVIRMNEMYLGIARQYALLDPETAKIMLGVPDEGIDEIKRLPITEIRRWAENAGGVALTRFPLDVWQTLSGTDRSEAELRVLSAAIHERRPRS